MLVIRRSLPIVLVSLSAQASNACVAAVEEPPLHAEAGAAAPKPLARAPHAYVHATPVLVLEELSGAEVARTRAALAPIARAVEACRPGSGAVIRLKLTASGDKASYTVQPTTSLDAEGRRCVLEALSTIEVDAIPGDASPLARPSGFTALFRFEW